MVWIVVSCCYTWCHCSSPPVGNSWADRVKGISCPVSPEVTRETTPQMVEHPVLPEPRVLSPVPSSLTESLDSFRETNGKILIVAIVFFFCQIMSSAANLMSVLIHIPKWYCCLLWFSKMLYIYISTYTTAKVLFRVIQNCKSLITPNFFISRYFILFASKRIHALHILTTA